MSRSRAEWEDETIADRSYSISSMYPGEKAACFYHHPEEMLETTVALIEAALKRHEMCVLLSRSPMSLMSERLKAMGVDPRAHPNLVIIPWSSVRLEDRSHQKMTEQLDAFSAQARAQGYAGAVLIIDVPQELAEQLPDMDGWFRLDRARVELGISVVCLYDMTSLSAELLLRSLTTYPTVIMQGMLCHNFYCLPRGLTVKDPSDGLYDHLNQLRVEHTQRRLIDEERSRLENINVHLQEEIVRRKMVEFALLQSQNNQSIMLDAMGDMVFMVDQELKVTMGNQAFIRYLDKSGLETAFEGRTIYELFPGLPPENRNLYQEIFKFGHTTITDESMQLEHGRIEAETRRVPVFKGETVDRIVVIIRIKPVTESALPGMWEYAALLKTAVLEPNGPLGNLLDACPHPVLVHDMDGKLFHFNQAACGALGYTREELESLGSIATIYLDPHRAPGHHRRFNYDGKICMPLTVRRKGGQPLEVMSYLSITGQGDGQRVISVLRLT